MSTLGQASFMREKTNAQTSPRHRFIISRCKQQRLGTCDLMSWKSWSIGFWKEKYLSCSSWKHLHQFPTSSHILIFCENIIWPRWCHWVDVRSYPIAWLWRMLSIPSAPAAIYAYLIWSSPQKVSRSGSCPIQSCHLSNIQKWLSCSRWSWPEITVFHNLETSPQAAPAPAVGGR